MFFKKTKKKLVKRFSKYILLPYKKLIFTIKSALPQTLLFRIFFIFSLTFLVIQVSIVIIFYDNYWRQLNNSLIDKVSENIISIIKKLENEKDTQKIHSIIEDANDLSPFALKMLYKEPQNNLKINSVKNNQVLLNKITENVENVDIHILQYNSQNIIERFYIKISDNQFLSFNLQGSILLSNSLGFLITLSLFLYMIGILIVWNFFRLQTRSLRKLSISAKNFAQHRTLDYILPSGAIEIRETTMAFNEMISQINDFIEQRTMMLSSVSHDLKTSLTKMQLVLEINKDNVIYQDLKEEIEDMSQMISSYLTFAKTDFTEVSLEEVNIFDFFEDLRKKYISENFKIDIDYFQSPQWIQFNQSMMIRSFNNLIENAKRFSTYLRIRIEDHSSHSIIIALSDNGVGIPIEEFPNVFKPFYKTNKARTPEKGSVGLGLYIVKDMIIKNRGNISLEESQYGGLKVNIILPS